MADSLAKYCYCSGWHISQKVPRQLAASVVLLVSHRPPLPMKNVRVKRFTSDQQMEDAIIASACIVPAPPINIQGIGTCIECAPLSARPC